MKRSNQNNFMPFMSNGNQVVNRFSNKRKSSLVAALSNTNQTIEDVNFVHGISTQKEDTDFYTNYDIDLENADLADETKSAPQLILDAMVTDRTDCIKQEQIFNEETPIISLHWAELTDYDLLTEQKPESGKEAVIMDTIPANDARDYKPYLWFV